MYMKLISTGCSTSVTILELYNYSTRGPIFGVELTLKFLEIKNISRERFKSLVYGGEYRFCVRGRYFFQTYVSDVMSLWQ